MTYPSQDPDAFEFPWPARQFLLENLDGIAPEKAAYLSLDPDAFDFTWILKYRKKQHARHKIRILLALGCRTLNYCTRKSDIPVTRSGFVRILDILILKLTRIAWRACHFCVGKLGFYCTRKSDTPNTGSGCIRTLEIQKSDFACLLVACCLLKKRHTRYYLSQDPDAFDFTWILKYTKKPHARQKIGILLALVCRKPWIIAHEKATYQWQDPDLFEF